MRKPALIKYVLLLLLISTVTAIAGTHRIEYSDQLLSFNLSNYHIRYDQLDNLTINHGFSIPIQTIYIELGAGSYFADISINNIDRQLLGIIPEELAQFDMPMTSAEMSQIIDIGLSRKISDIIYDYEIISMNNSSYLRLSILPITMLNGGLIAFNKSIDLEISGSMGEIRSSQFIHEKYQEIQSATRSFLSKTSSDYGLPLGCKYVIVTSPPLDSVFNILAKFKTNTGMSTEIAYIDSVYFYYDGIDEAEKLRNYLIDFYNSGGEYVLLGGDERILPVRYVYYYNAVSPPVDQYNFMPSDLYFADIDGIWDLDNDGIFGEPTHDQPDLIPDLKVGRIPVASDSLAGNYVEKLIDYYTNPGGGDYEYLTNSLIFTADQMRDYPAGGQHAVIAGAIPETFYVDTTEAVEYPSGNDPNPTAPNGPDCVDRIADGFGLVHILAHGRTDGFMVRSANYGEWPASYILSTLQASGQGSLFNLEQNGKTSLYYSLACDMGGYDLDSISGAPTGWSFVERILAIENGGAVGMVGNTRWGWVYSSYLLEQSFTEHLFGDAEGSPVTAMYLSWLDHPFYRDLIYGQNYYGDPTLTIYLEQPENLGFELNPLDLGQISVMSENTKLPVPNAELYLISGETIIEEGITDAEGLYSFSTPLTDKEGYFLTIVKDGFTVSQDTLIVSLALDSDDDDIDPVPYDFVLEQNYPNPFNPVTHIPFSIPMRSDIEMQIFNVLGQKVWDKVLYDQSAGSHTVTWNGENNSGIPVASGFYFYRIVAGEQRQTRKMVLMR